MNRKSPTPKQQKPRTNPNGANQYLFDPRQKTMWEYYSNPKSATWSNATKSAVKAGYTKTTADRITTETWFLEKVRRMNLLSKAEKVLDETLEMDTEVTRVEGQNPIKDSGLVRIKADVAKFVASTQGKNEGYSTREEVDVTSGGEPIKGFNYIVPDESNDKA